MIKTRKQRKAEIESGKIWTCEYCGQINKSEDGKCINCGAPRRHL